MEELAFVLLFLGGEAGVGPLVPLQIFSCCEAVCVGLKLELLFSYNRLSRVVGRSRDELLPARTLVSTRIMLLSSSKLQTFYLAVCFDTL